MVTAEIHKPSTATLPTRREVDALASEVRRIAAAEIAESFLADYEEVVARAEIDRSIFRDIVDDLHMSNPVQTASFSLAVTEESLSRLIADIDDAGLLAFAFARVLELGGYTFIDPKDPLRTQTHLGASKQFGYFFTPPEVADYMARRAMGDRQHINRVLDPAAGAGSLLAAVLIHAAASGVSIDRITAVELDETTTGHSQELLSRIADLVGSNASLEIVNADAFEWLDPERGEHADCIVMNPPYGRVKFLRSSLTNGETARSEKSSTHKQQAKRLRSRYQIEAHRLRELSDRLGLGRGPQDYQRIFLGLGAQGLAEEGGFAFIAPASWLGDNDSGELRRKLLRERLLEEVVIYPEDSGLFATVNQVTAVAVLRKGESNGAFLLNHAEGATVRAREGFRVAYHAIERLDPNRHRIPRLRENQYHLYERLQAFPRLKAVDGLDNLRGELDQSAGRRFIVEEESDIRLVRGDHLERFYLGPPDASKRAGFIDAPKYLAQMAGKPKTPDMNRWRAVGRQVSYMNKKRRLSFAVVPPGCVVGNSCNYLVVRGESDSVKTRSLMEALCVILNSSIAEWFFRVNNSNNHVANYELDDLPVFDVGEHLDLLSRLYRFMEFQMSDGKNAGRRLPYEDVLDAFVGWCFGLSASDLRMVLVDLEVESADRSASMLDQLRAEGIRGRWTAGEGWFDHVVPTTSDLDQEIIQWVPQGGNWQDIPESVPSQRLAQIREMTSWRGIVRTTYYGRLRPDQPAYTIATYYNRPGNGTNINPWVDRTLTHREAARLQSFPDSYLFLGGTDGTVRKQIGNAVPPLLGFAVGVTMGAAASNATCVDLFAGAGGLSLGLELAGRNVIAAVDNDPKTLETYRFNRPTELIPDPESPKTLVVESDLSNHRDTDDVIRLIKSKLDGRRLGALAGGPPCQGFSTAGWRARDDERNDLAVAFLRFVEALEPEQVLIENVEGLLSYGGGSVVSEILSTLRELGYDVGSSPWRLEAERYGVPQMRRRVFIVGQRGDTPIHPPAPLFQKCLGRRESTTDQSLFEEALPYPITVGEAIGDLPRMGEVSHGELGQRVWRPSFLQWIRGEISPLDFFEATRV